MIDHRGRLWLIGMLVVLIVTVNSPTPVEACSCADPWPVEEALEKRDAVFSGTVLKIERPRRITSSATLITVTLKVDQVWKGDVEEVVTVKTAVSTASCGYPFVENESYLIYASHDGNDFRTGLCDRTALLNQARSDLEQLGPGHPPISLPQANSQSSGNANQFTEAKATSWSPGAHSPWWETGPLSMVTVGGIMVLLLAAVVLIVKRRRST